MEGLTLLLAEQGNSQPVTSRNKSLKHTAWSYSSLLERRISPPSPRHDAEHQARGPGVGGGAAQGTVPAVQRAAPRPPAVLTSSKLLQHGLGSPGLLQAGLLLSTAPECWCALHPAAPAHCSDCSAPSPPPRRHYVPELAARCTHPGGKTRLQLQVQRG